MKTILITGGAGFIGSNMVRYLYSKYPRYKIIVVDALTYAGNVENLPVSVQEIHDERFEFCYGDVRNSEVMEELVSRSDIVIHFAAETHVTRSIFHNRAFFETDVLGTHTVATSVLKHKASVERFIHISTSEVYGSARAPLMSEEHPLFPMSPYASAKTGADRLVYSYHVTYDVPAIIVRPFNNFGPLQHLEKAIPRFITCCILGEPLQVHGDGSAMRDFTYVSDTCEAIDLLMHTDINKIRGEVFNLASARHRSILSVAQDILRLMKADPGNVEFVGERPGQVFRHTGSYDKIRETLGWTPKVSWEDGLLKTIEWYRSHPEWWKKQMWMRAVPITTGKGKTEMH